MCNNETNVNEKRNNEIKCANEKRNNETSQYE